MNDFLKTIEEIETVLKPFITQITPDALSWDGTAYVKKEEERPLDPYALAWWSSLFTTRSLLQSQECPLTTDQKEYLRKTLFGGMGSLTDFAIDESLFGQEAKKANRKLENLFNELYENFENL